MILLIRNLIAYLICAIASTAIVGWIQSTVVTDILIPNLITIVIALLAINVQTTAVIAVKLRELADKHGLNFRLSIREFKVAIYEQGSLVIASLTLSAISKAKVEVLNSILIDCFSFFVLYASLHIFLDTTIGLLFSLFPEDNVNK